MDSLSKIRTVKALVNEVVTDETCRKYFFQYCDDIEKDLTVLSILKDFCYQAKDAYDNVIWGKVEFSLKKVQNPKGIEKEIEDKKEIIREWLSE